MFIDETHSTSSLLRETYDDSLPHLFTIRTDFQTAGRGQAGNSWESERGKNLLFSALLRYNDLYAVEQWRLSMLVAVALWDVLAKYLPESQLRIKWPNDVYFGDKKLVGILIENSLSGKYVGYSIVGIGVNINQTQWLSNAPNPISMKEISGREYDAEMLMNQWITSVQSWEMRTTDEIKTAYHQRLYRRNGWYEYVEREVNLTPTAIAQRGTEDSFLAEIVDVTKQGELVLRLQNNEEKIYHFKQIRFVI